MARAGEQSYNPVQKDWIVFRETAQDTRGQLMSAEIVFSPHGGNPLHVHPNQEEHFKVLSDTLGVQIGEEHRSLGEGEEATVPPGTPHRLSNAQDEEVRILGEVRPALNTETFLETLYGLARDGRTDKSGVPNLLQFAVMLDGLHKVEIYLAKPPIAFQMALFGLLSPAGKVLGYEEHYPKYSEEVGTAGVEGAGPPSKTSVIARGATMATSLLVASLFLLGRMRRRSKG